MTYPSCSRKLTVEEHSMAVVVVGEEDSMAPVVVEVAEERHRHIRNLRLGRCTLQRKWQIRQRRQSQGRICSF